MRKGGREIAIFFHVMSLRKMGGRKGRKEEDLRTGVSHHF